ncbi:MAG TPA: glycosyltransferase family 2 protein [Candidatus Enterenecus faecium]|uniref:Glycosyltransferase family 2 protein n=1 Tax=Candidatus Enterenecus faecium TaxID=2840780 RepID=A0A9D0YTU5_9FIRM|nr:glycosyltransferase family 2 protein [Candidatus Enterenecus faecium]
MAACDISVIIPVYNIQQHLRECLDSVLGQSYPHLQVICVDDGSTDESPAILAEYAQKDPRVQVIRQQNAGPGAARNTGLEAAKGEYVIFLDSDDWFEPDFLAKMVDTAQREGADVAICRAVEFDTNSGRELPSEWMMKKQYLPGKLAFAPQEMADHLFQFTYGMPWDKFYRRELLTSSGIRYPALKNSEDLAFVYPTLLAAKRIAVVDQVLIHHRINRMASVSNSRCGQPEAPYEAFQIVKEYLEQHQLMDTYRRSFLNWAMEFLVWHISNMSQRDIQRQYLQTLRRQWLPQLHFEEHPASYYESKSCYAKYLLARYAPYPVFAAVVKVYKKAKHGGQ